VGTVLFAFPGRRETDLQAAQCLSNMRQWGLAMGMYCNDWHDYMPYEGSANGVDDNIDLSAWFQCPPALHEPNAFEGFVTIRLRQHSLAGAEVDPHLPKRPEYYLYTYLGAPYFSYAMDRVNTAL